MSDTLSYDQYFEVEGQEVTLVDFEAAWVNSHRYAEVERPDGTRVLVEWSKVNVGTRVRRCSRCKLNHKPYRNKPKLSKDSLLAFFRFHRDTKIPCYPSLKVRMCEGLTEEEMRNA